MSKWTDLNASHEKAFAALQRKILQEAQRVHTRPAGVKDLGETGDITWGSEDPETGAPVERSVRNVDVDLSEARDRIQDAAEQIETAKAGLAEAKAEAEAAASRLDELDATTLPAVRAELEAQATAAADTFADLDQRLADFATDEALAPLRQALADANTAADNASSEAATAQSTADDAAASALAAAGIAADKGRIFYQSAEPTGDDRSPNNLWIDSDDGRVYVWNGSAWEESQSEDLRDAAQAAVAAQQAAEAADSKAQAAAAAAAAADQKAQDAADAAAAAQQTADDATIDARNAHNEAVAARDRVNAAIESGASLIVNGSFENGDIGWPTGGSHSGRSRIIEDPNAHTGSYVLELTPTTANTYPESDNIAVTGGQILYVRGWFKHLGGDGRLVRLLCRTLDKDRAPIATPTPASANPQTKTIGEWFLLEGDYEVPQGIRYMRFAFHANQSTSTYHADDLQVIDVTEARKAQRAAEAAMAEAAKKLDESQVQAIADATEASAIAAAKAEDELLEARAATEAARIAKAEAEREAGEAEAAAKAYADLIDTGASDADLAAARTYAEEQAEQARVAAEKAAAADATAKTEAAEARAAQDASDKADQALTDAKASLDAARGEITNEITASANGKNSITRSLSAPSGDGVVHGDQWYQVDGNGDAFASWYWGASGWTPSLIKNEMMESLDVHKLQVTGEAKIDTAVIDKLFAETFAAHKITASELTIASVDSAGNLADGAVGAVHIEDGAISTPKLNVTGEMSAALVNAMETTTKKLVVTEEAVLQHATLIGETVVDDINVQGKLIGTDGVFTGTVDFENVNVTGGVLAQRIMSSSGLVAGDPAGERLEITGQGLTLYSGEKDDAGVDLQLAHLGPGADENLLTIGSSTVSTESVSARSAAFDTLTIGGDSLSDVLASGPRGVVAFAFAGVTSQWDGSGVEQNRLQADAVLEPGRRYSVTVDQHYVQTRTSAATSYVEFIRWDNPLTSSGVSPSSPSLAQARHSLASGTTAETVGSMVGWMDTGNWTAPRRLWFMVSNRGPLNRDIRIVAGTDYPLRLTITDEGPSLTETGRSWMHNGTPKEGASEAPGTGTEVKRYTETWAHGGAGGDRVSDKGLVYQGTLSPYGNRSGGWLFSAAMRSALSGATIEKLEVYLENHHWYNGSGGTARIVPNNGTLSGPSFGTTNVESAGWARGAGRWVTIPASWYPSVANGTYRGVNMYATSTSLVYYGQFKVSPTKFRATYRK